MQVLKKGKDRDALVGAVVIVTATLLFGFVYGKEMHSGDSGGYTVNARFRRADGISLGSDVRLSGVVVGKVVAEELDQQFRAITTLRLASNLGLPMDTAAVIQTDGLLGAKYIELRPGAEDDVLKPGQEITFTQDSMVLEDLLDLIINQARAKRGYLDRPLPGAA